MASTLPSDLVVYDRLAQTAYLERIQKNLDLFNAQSRGAIVLRSEAIQGDFDKKTFYPEFGALAYRNISSNSAVTPSNITADERVGVKSPWKFGPYATSEEAFKRRNRSPAEFYQVVGEAAADATREYMAQAALASVAAAIGGNSAMQASGTASGRKGLINGFRKFGDKFNRVALFVMSSANYFDLVDAAVTDKLFEEAGVVIYGGAPGTLGKPVLVTDLLDDSPDYVYALQPGAVEIVESQAPGFRSYLINDAENLQIGYRAEGVFNVNLLGYSWDLEGSPAAPANPNLGALGSSANWRKHATDNKNTAGVRILLT